MSEWKKSENSNSVRPSDVDAESSNSVVYIRKDFKLVPAEEGEQGRPEHYEYYEKEVSKSDWDTYKTIITHDTEIGEVQDALIELSELVGVQ